VQTGRHLVAVVVELATSVQHGHHDFCRAHAAVRHDPDRNSTTVVLHDDTAVVEDRDANILAVTG
jgi:hypothetical protein